MAPNIYWVGGGKGGVGTSMVSMALLDCMFHKGMPALFMESDTSNPDVYKAYRAVLPTELVDVHHVDGWIQVVNSCDANRDKDVVVNTPARSATGVAKFGGTLCSSLAELERSLVGLWAINRHRDGVELLKDFSDAMPSCRVHVLRNLYFGDESKFELYAASKALRPRVESGGGKSLKLSRPGRSCGRRPLQGSFDDRGRCGKTSVRQSRGPAAVESGCGPDVGGGRGWVTPSRFPTRGSRRCSAACLARPTGRGVRKVPDALGIRSTDTVWDIMIALDYHVQLYAAVPDKLAEQTRLAAAELGRIVEGAKRKRGTVVGKLWRVSAPSEALRAWPRFWELCWLRSGDGISGFDPGWAGSTWLGAAAVGKSRRSEFVGELWAGLGRKRSIAPARDRRPDRAVGAEVSRTGSE
jgi:hypothetical protein